jgi:carbamoyl-phosphate synthase large subunit
MLAEPLDAKGFPILGTQCDAIHQGEDRQSFKKLLESLGLQQPPNDTFQTAQEALEKVVHIGYPCILRPSYVLGGRGLTKIHNRRELETYLATCDLTHPILMERFMAHAMELDVDAIHDGQATLICGILEQLEPAGIHSGDSSCILPTVHVPQDMLDKIQAQTHAIAKALRILGFLNIQFLIHDGELYVLEANPRASRTIPIVSKATGVPLVKVATRVILGQSLKEQGYISNTIAPHDESHQTLDTRYTSIPAPNLFFLKEPVFSFSKLPGADTTLGPEMKSTGELMLVGRTLDEVMAKAHGESLTEGMGVYGLKMYPKKKGTMKVPL